MIGPGPSGGFAAKRPVPQAGPAPIVLVDLRERPRERLTVPVPGLERSELDELLAATAERAPALAVAVSSRADEQDSLRLAGWCHAGGTLFLPLAIDVAGARLGPLSVPGRVGCAHCAHQRIRAAAAFSSAASRSSAAERKLVRWAGRALSEEIAAACSDPLSSSLIDHVRATDGAGEPTRHRVIPPANCPICGGLRTLAAAGDAVADPDPLAGWVDPLTGVIPALQVDQPEGFGLPAVVTAAPPHVVDADGSLRALPAGWGKGLTLADALRSAVGEAVERYSASLPDPDRLVWARPSDLRGDSLEPRLFPLYRADQYARAGFPYVPFDPEVLHPWVRGAWLSGGTGEVWVPALFAFLTLTLEPQHLICQGSSNGLAASTDWEDAALRAVLELIERDAMMSAWLTGEGGPRLELDASLDPAYRELVEGIEALEAAVELYLLPSAGGSTVLSLALGDGASWPGANVALAADLNPAAAVRKSLLELGQTGPYLRELLLTKRLEPPAKEADVRTMLDHAAYYFPAERAAAFAALRSAERTLTYAALAGWEGERSLDACAAALEQAELRVALVDVTAPDVATGPFWVARAVSPDLQPLSYGYGLERMPVKRICSRSEVADAPAIHPIW